MSIPSSKDAVATHTFTRPVFSPCSAAKRVARERLPWWATTASSPNRSASWWETLSTKRLVLTNTNVVEWALARSVMVSSVSPQISWVAMGPISSLGSWMSRSNCLEWPVSTIRQLGLPWSSMFAEPTRNLATSSIGFWVAERPMLVIGSSHKFRNRSTDRERWEPLLSSATA